MEIDSLTRPDRSHEWLAFRQLHELLDADQCCRLGLDYRLVRSQRNSCGKVFAAHRIDNRKIFSRWEAGPTAGDGEQK
jgi:hypothetical protein